MASSSALFGIIASAIVHSFLLTVLVICSRMSNKPLPCLPIRSGRAPITTHLTVLLSGLGFSGIVLFCLDVTIFFLSLRHDTEGTAAISLGIVSEVVFILMLSTSMLYSTLRLYLLWGKVISVVVFPLFLVVLTVTFGIVSSPALSSAPLPPSLQRCRPMLYVGVLLHDIFICYFIRRKMRSSLRNIRQHLIRSASALPPQAQPDAIEENCDEYRTIITVFTRTSLLCVLFFSALTIVDLVRADTGALMQPLLHQVAGLLPVLSIYQIAHAICTRDNARNSSFFIQSTEMEFRASFAPTAESA